MCQAMQLSPAQNTILSLPSENGQYLVVAASIVIGFMTFPLEKSMYIGTRWLERDDRLVV